MTLPEPAPSTADIFKEWNRGELDSYLMEITVEVLRQVDAKTGKPLVDGDEHHDPCDAREHEPE
ncbi:MAG: hypothetical protein E7L00_05450 [Propionibacteriaceae bacterium]|nr:hypothetical protein [Propionibacteriaceae bacterium]